MEDLLDGGEQDGRVVNTLAFGSKGPEVRSPAVTFCAAVIAVAETFTYKP